MTFPFTSEETQKKVISVAVFESMKRTTSCQRESAERKMETKSITKEEIMSNVTLDMRKSLSTGKTYFPHCEQLKKTLFLFASKQHGFQPTGTENKANIAAMDGLFPAAVDDTHLAAVCSPQSAAASSQTSPVVGQSLSK